eukprot:1196274-Prorocentrum_minimum.AAC.4
MLERFAVHLRIGAARFALGEGSIFEVVNGHNLLGNSFEGNLAVTVTGTCWDWDRDRDGENKKIELCASLHVPLVAGEEDAGPGVGGADDGRPGLPHG